MVSRRPLPAGLRQRDGTPGMRLAPDGPDFARVPAADSHASGATKASEEQFDKASARPSGSIGRRIDTTGGQRTTDSGDWVTISTFLPDGTCREDRVR